MIDCPKCGTEMIWGGDNDCEDEEFSIESNFSCPDCETMVIVYWPRDKPASCAGCCKCLVTEERLE